MPTSHSVSYMVTFAHILQWEWVPLKFFSADAIVFLLSVIIISIYFLDLF